MNPIDQRLELLGLRRGVTREELRSSFRAVIRTTHPDRFQGDEARKVEAEARTKRVIEAYNYLVDHFEETSPVATGPESPRPAEGHPLRPEDRTERKRRSEEKKRQDAEYQRRKAAREAREAWQRIQDRERKTRERQTWVLGILFVILLVIYAGYSRRQASMLDGIEVQSGAEDQE